jgi:phospholipase D1/2
LDHLLEAKAKMGIKIYILLYKEVSMALKINSNYSKQRLLALHENIKVDGQIISHLVCTYGHTMRNW